MDIKEKLGNEIRRLREAKGYSQESFANVCGIHRTYISGIERGERNVSLENIEKIANALEITISDLFSYDTPVRRSINITVNGEDFRLESNKDLTKDIKNHLEAIADTMYSEDNDWYEDIYEMTTFEILDLYIDEVFKETGIKLVSKAIDLELTIEED